MAASSAGTRLPLASGPSETEPRAHAVPSCNSTLPETLSVGDTVLLRPVDAMLFLCCSIPALTPVKVVPNSHPLAC
jgi:hypothetical protein